MPDYRKPDSILPCGIIGSGFFYFINEVFDVQMISLFNATTAAAISGGVSVDHGKATTFVADGTLETGETIPVEIRTASGWVAVVEGGTAVALSADDNVVSTDKPGVYRVNKGVTSGAVGVTVYLS